MDPREPAGGEGGKGKSAELLPRARENGGAVGNTCGTVCGANRRGAIRLQSCLRLSRRVWAVGRSVSLPTFILPSEKNKKYGGHSHEV